MMESFKRDSEHLTDPDVEEDGLQLARTDAISVTRLRNLLLNVMRETHGAEKCVSASRKLRVDCDLRTGE